MGQRTASGADAAKLARLANRLRKHSIEMTTAAGSGHPTTCLSAAEIMAVLFFDEMRWNPAEPRDRAADAFVLSKGHAAPILYAVLKESGALDDDLLTLRKFDSRLEGHPMPRLPWTRVATGSLGQGLSAACGIAVAKRLDGLDARVYCLLGDGEIAEGSVWEAAQFGAVNRLSNLAAIVDLNGLGQSGPTMHGHDGEAVAAKWRAFGWEAVVCDGHSVDALRAAFAALRGVSDRPGVVIAKTEKGKGVSFLQGKPGWHGKPLKPDEAAKAIAELGDCEVILAPPARPLNGRVAATQMPTPIETAYRLNQAVATREAYGNALAKLGASSRDVVVTDGEVKNSTFAERFLAAAPDRFFEGWIAEQNMAGVALGLASEGKIAFASSFAAFLSRAYDFIRMAGYSQPDHLIFVGSHAGVSIGEDGPSQMALEDLAMMRAIFNMTVLYPSDAVCAEKLTYEAARTKGLVYIRTSRPKTSVLYGNDETFPVGGSKTLRSSENDRATIVAAGVTVYEALEAYERLKARGISVRVVDAYSIKPLDETTLVRAAAETGFLVTVEDHGPHGGLGEAVAAAVAGLAPVRILAVREVPRSGSPKQLLAAYGIDAAAIVQAVTARVGGA